jgi:hypothetical protein
MEASALGAFMREGTWTYAIVNLSHILGISTLFGSILILDLRLIGLWRRVPLAALARAAVPVSAVGLAVALGTGVGLIATNGTEYIGNPFLLIKFPAIALGLINVAVLNLSPAWRARDQRELSPRENRGLAAIGAVSLISWTSAVAAGRMIGYW